MGERRAKVHAETGIIKNFAGALRKEPTPAEARAWSMLRAHRFLGLKFRRQHVVEGKVVDFYCQELRLCVELDGAPHFSALGIERDKARDAFLESKGYKVFHFTNDELFDYPGAFADRLANICHELRQAPPL